MTLEERKKLYADDLKAREAWEKDNNIKLEGRHVDGVEWRKLPVYGFESYYFYRLPQKTDKEKLYIAIKGLKQLRGGCAFPLHPANQGIISDLLKEIS